MTQAIVSGLGFGMVLAFLPGPVFFALIQTGINKGFKYGILFALGVALSDIAFIGLTYYGVSGFLENPAVKKVFGIAGGMFMCLFGIFYILKKSKKSVPYEQMGRKKGSANLVFKGFALNIFNPAVFFFWVGIVSAINLEFDANQTLIFTFFITSIVTVFGLDILKSFVANLIKSFFTQRFLLIVNRALGVILFGIGVRLIVKALTNTLSV
jgi:L-lysine exporter family protein LysE/ArgO